MTEKPLISVILYGLNAAEYVEEALQSLLSQDYENIEYYFSDDGSTDETFTLMERASAQTSRPVQLARSCTNCGICSQINVGVSRTKGSLILLANADDIYPADYVSTLMESWAARKSRPTLLWADLEQIDELSKTRSRIIEQRLGGDTLHERVASRCSGPGATGLLFDRRVYDCFGPLPDNLILEDACISLRAFLLGEASHIRKPIVRYRVHDGNISQVYAAGDYDAWLSRRTKRAIWHMNQGHRAFVEMLRDMHERPAEAFPAEDLKRARWTAVEKIAETAILADYYAGDRTITDGERWGMLARLAKLQLKLTVKRLFPFIERRNELWEYKTYTKAR